MNEYTVCRRCKANRPPLGNDEHALCRVCYANAVRSAINNIMLCEDCSEWCDECDHTYKQKKKLYFEHNKKACICEDCGTAKQFHVLSVLFNGKFQYGDAYMPTSCRACAIKRDIAFNEADAIRLERVRPCVPYAGIAYRIQNADGVGPFRSKRKHSAECMVDDMFLSFMGVPQDEGLYDLSGVYAFTSMEALHYYVSPKLLAFWQSTGYTLIEVRTGNKEVHIFDNGLQVLIPR